MSKWTQKEEEFVETAWLIDELTQKEIAEKLDRSKSAVTRKLGRMGLTGEKGNWKLHRERNHGYREGAKIRPVRIELPERAHREPESFDEVTLHWSDVHFPFQDRQAVEILYQITRDVQPSGLYMQGDLIDCYQLSDHRAPLEKHLDPDEIDLQASINQAVEHLATMKSASGASEAHLFLGNHEDRWDRMLEEIQGSAKLSHLLRLPKIQEALTLEYLLGTDELGYQTHPYIQGAPFVLHDRVVLVHGDKANKWTTWSMLEKYGKSSIFGHTHRIQNFTRRDLRGTDSSWNVGCLCDLDPHWIRFPQWAHGFAIVTWKETSTGWLYSLQQIRIHNGRAVYRDKLYTA